ncbi:uncharacterized protein B0H18DRAFT_996065 [Fomitopsis serialis]|uniref:uncharacterized protein n=1 Tax=Fomitopsis serialis TaxID=139415 RepID=UPI00200828CE|nr:uncharacterized protein B0H18DRAFT_996065 [Neoantrodia serialis]KAH9929746.1 hypothetical protein B0H18DRAFT_996065 [Neoantrodia serialis]
MALASTAVNLREYSLPIQCLDALKILKRIPAASLCVYNLQDEPREPASDWSLTQLAAPSRAIWECPIRILQDLTHLTIDNGGHLGNITLLFHHCAQLQALHIVLRPDSPMDLYAALEAHPSALPHLTHLKLQLTRPAVITTEREALAGFIRTKKRLRCLDYSDASTTVELAPVLTAIRSLSSLEVLGLDLCLEDVGRGQCDSLRDAMPDGLRALRLWLEYMDLVPEDNEWDDWYWATLPKLAFAHVDDDGSLPMVDWPDIAVPTNTFELGEPWPSTKVLFRTAEDFGCEDWEWLMRGHAQVDEFDY